MKTEKEIQNYLLEPGHIYLGGQNTRVQTVLGSGVAVCIWDTKLKQGAINHFIYPRVRKHPRTVMFGDVSIIHMMRLLLDQGSNKHNWIVQICGGSTPPGDDPRKSIGRKNIKSAHRLLKKTSLQIHSEDCGGFLGRKIVFDLGTGQLAVMKVHRLREGDWVKEELK